MPTFPPLVVMSKKQNSEFNRVSSDDNKLPTLFDFISHFYNEKFSVTDEFLKRLKDIDETLKPAKLDRLCRRAHEMNPDFGKTITLGESMLLITNAKNNLTKSCNLLDVPPVW